MEPAGEAAATIDLHGWIAGAAQAPRQGREAFRAFLADLRRTLAPRPVEVERRPLDWTADNAEAGRPERFHLVAGQRP